MEKKQLERYWLHIIKEQRNRGTGEFWHSIGKRLERGKRLNLFIDLCAHTCAQCMQVYNNEQRCFAFSKWLTTVKILLIFKLFSWNIWWFRK